MEDMEARMKDVLAVMRDSATLPLREPVTSIGGRLISGESARMEERRRKGTSILKRRPGRAVIYAMAVLEVNTSTGTDCGSTYSRVFGHCAGTAAGPPGGIRPGGRLGGGRPVCSPLPSDTWPCAMPPCQGR